MEDQEEENSRRRRTRLRASLKERKEQKGHVSVSSRVAGEGRPSLLEAHLPSGGGDHPCPRQVASNVCTHLSGGLQESEKADQYFVPLG